MRYPITASVENVLDSITFNGLLAQGIELSNYVFPKITKILLTAARIRGINLAAWQGDAGEIFRGGNTVQTIRATLLICLLATVLAPAGIGQTKTAAMPQSSTMEPGKWAWTDFSIPVGPTQQTFLQDYMRNETHLQGPPLPGSGLVSNIGPKVPETVLRGFPQTLGPAPEDPAVFVGTALDNSATNGDTSVVGEPSVGNSGDLVFQTGNWHAAASRDGGNTFSYVNPYTTFPASDRGFCCDQIVAYDPNRDLIIWLLQYVHDATRNRQRLAVARASDFDSGWCYYDFLPEQFGWTGQWFDFPDLSVGASYLYLTTNVFTIASPERFTRSALLRLPLDPISQCGGFNFSFVADTDHFTFRPAQGITSTAYWAAHNNTSSMRVYSWDEGSDQYFYNDVAVTQWNDLARRCPGPDGRDWCGRSDSRILGAALSNTGLGFMWSASQGGAFPFPYVDVARVDPNSLTLIDQPIIFNRDFAFSYPAASPNGRGDLGLSLFAGGGPLFPTHVLGFVDDISPDGLLLATVASTQGPNSSGDWGDYVTVRSHAPDGLTWIATGYSLQGGGGDSNVQPLYFWFGRYRDRP
jgi:hypothetical protein